MNALARRPVGPRRRPAAAVALLLGAGLAGACGEPAAPVAEEPGVLLAIVAGDGQEAVTPLHADIAAGPGAMPESLRVRVTDAEGRPLAGRVVEWRTEAGALSPMLARTDAAGMAAARWSLHSPNRGWARSGAHVARASVHDGGEARFSGLARSGVLVDDVSYSSYTVDVGAGAAGTTMTLRLSNGRPDVPLTRVWVDLHGPATATGATPSVGAELALVERTRVATTVNPIGDGVGGRDDETWSGTFTFPADAPVGAWKPGRVQVAWGDDGAERGEMPGSRLDGRNIGHVMHVIRGAPGGP